MLFVCTLTYEPLDGFLPNLQRYFFIGQPKGMIIFSDLDHISKLSLPLNYEKALSAPYLLNQWPDFDQTGTDASLGGP